MRYRDGKPVAIEKRADLDPARRGGRARADPERSVGAVVEPALPADLYDADALRKEFLRQPDGPVRHRRAGRRRGPDRAQDHRRHVRRFGPPRRRRVLRQGPVEGRPLGRVRGALRGQEHRRRRAGGPLRGAGRLRDRRRAPGRVMVETFGTEKIAASRSRSWSTSTSTCARAPSARSSSCTARSTEDRRVRPLRPRRHRLHVGEHRQGRRAARGRGPRRRWPSPSLDPSPMTRQDAVRASASACSAARRPTSPSPRRSSTRCASSARWATTSPTRHGDPAHARDEHRRRRARRRRQDVLLEGRVRLGPQHPRDARHPARRLRDLRAQALRRVEAAEVLFLANIQPDAPARRARAVRRTRGSSRWTR